MASSQDLLASLGVASSKTPSKPREKVSEVLDLFPGSPDPLATRTPAPPPAAKPAAKFTWPEVPPQTDKELLGPLAPVSATSNPLAPVEAVPARSTSEEALAPWTEAPALSQAEAYLPTLTRLYAGETLVDRPTDAKRLGGERAEPGRIYVTSCRLLWEPTPASGGPTRGAAGTPGGGAVVLALHAIDRFRKPKGGLGGAGGPRDLDELSGGTPEVERGSSGSSSSSKLRQLTGRSSKPNAIVEAELFLKWGALPALRLQVGRHTTWFSY